MSVSQTSSITATESNRHTSNTYFITHDINTATSVVHDLMENHVTQDQIGVVGQPETLAVANLPEAELTEVSDIQNAAKRGAALGGATGLLAGLVVTAFPPAGVALGGSALAAMAAGGAALGTWSASMIGVSEHSVLVEKLESKLNDDAILVLADIETEQQIDVMKSVADNNRIPLHAFGSIT
ncbi:MAG: DUF1269 domain-containing protein [Gammaproteobacteria bacterium]|nr:DUF1269 domain-containing protein [Gammaproteobacteria bacterium]